MATLKQNQGEYGFGLSKFDCEDNEIATTLDTWLEFGHYLTLVEPEPLGSTVGDKHLDYTQSSIVKEKRRARGFDTSIAMVSFGYGVNDNVNLDVYLTGSEIDPGGPAKSTKGYSCGAGLRINLYQEGRLTVGTLARWRRFDWEDEMSSMLGPTKAPGYWPGSFAITEAAWEMDYNEWMFAVGPTFEISEGWTIYGGPCYSIIKGKMRMEYKYDGKYISWDERDEEGHGLYETQTISVGQKGNAEFEIKGIGFMFGTEIVIKKQLAMCFEADITGDNSTFGTRIACRF